MHARVPRARIQVGEHGRRAAELVRQRMDRSVGAGPDDDCAAHPDERDVGAALYAGDGSQHDRELRALGEPERSVARPRDERATVPVERDGHALPAVWSERLGGPERGVHGAHGCSHGTACGPRRDRPAVRVDGDITDRGTRLLTERRRRAPESGRRHGRGGAERERHRSRGDEHPCTGSALTYELRTCRHALTSMTHEGPRGLRDFPQPSPSEQRDRTSADALQKLRRSAVIHECRTRARARAASVQSHGARRERTP